MAEISTFPESLVGLVVFFESVDFLRGECNWQYVIGHLPRR